MLEGIDGFMNTFVEEIGKSYKELCRLDFLHRRSRDIYHDDKSQENYDAMVDAMQTFDKAFDAYEARFGCRKCACCECDDACCSKAAVD